MKSFSKIFLVGVWLAVMLTGDVFSQKKHPAEEFKKARTVSTDFQTSVDFYNESGRTVKLFWLNQNGDRVFSVSLKPRQRTTATTFISQPWLVTDEQDNAWSLFYPDAQPREIKIVEPNVNAGAGAGNRPPQNTVPGRYEDDEDFDYSDLKVKYDETPIKMCKNQETPRGYVIIRAFSDFGCPNWNAVNNNAYTIKRPSLTELTSICGNQDIPRGFVIVRAGNDFGCSNWTATGVNSYTIRRPRDTEKICSVSPVPRRFIVTREYADFNCPNWNAAGVNAKEIRRVN